MEKAAPAIYARPESIGHADESIESVKTNIASLEEKLAAAITATANHIVKDGEPEQKIRGELRVARQHLESLEKHKGLLKGEQAQTAASAPSLSGEYLQKPDPNNW